VNDSLDFFLQPLNMLWHLFSSLVKKNALPIKNKDLLHFHAAYFTKQQKQIICPKAKSPFAKCTYLM